MARRFRDFERSGRVFSFEPGVKERRGKGALASIRTTQSQLTGRHRLEKEEFGRAGSGLTELIKLALFDKAGGLAPIDEVFVEEPADIILRLQEANDFAQAQPDLVKEEQRIRSLPIRKTGRVIETLGSNPRQETLEQFKKQKLSRNPDLRARQLQIRARVAKLAERERREALTNPRLKRILEAQQDG